MDATSSKVSGLQSLGEKKSLSQEIVDGLKPGDCIEFKAINRGQRITCQLSCDLENVVPLFVELYLGGPWECKTQNKDVLSQENGIVVGSILINTKFVLQIETTQLQYKIYLNHRQICVLDYISELSLVNRVDITGKIDTLQLEFKDSLSQNSENDENKSDNVNDSISIKENRSAQLQVTHNQHKSQQEHILNDSNSDIIVPQKSATQQMGLKGLLNFATGNKELNVTTNLPTVSLQGLKHDETKLATNLEKENQKSAKLDLKTPDISSVKKSSFTIPEIESEKTINLNSSNGIKSNVSEGIISKLDNATIETPLVHLSSDADVSIASNKSKDENATHNLSSGIKFKHGSNNVQLNAVIPDIKSPNKFDDFGINQPNIVNEFKSTNVNNNIDIHKFVATTPKIEDEVKLPKLDKIKSDVDIDVRHQKSDDQMDIHYDDGIDLKMNMPTIKSNSKVNIVNNILDLENNAKTKPVKISEDVNVNASAGHFMNTYSEMLQHDSPTSAKMDLSGVKISTFQSDTTDDHTINTSLDLKQPKINNDLSIKLGQLDVDKPTKPANANKIADYDTPLLVSHYNADNNHGGIDTEFNIQVHTPDVNLEVEKPNITTDYKLNIKPNKIDEETHVKQANIDNFVDHSMPSVHHSSENNMGLKINKPEVKMPLIHRSEDMPDDHVDVKSITIKYDSDTDTTNIKDEKNSQIKFPNLNKDVNFKISPEHNNNDDVDINQPGFNIKIPKMKLPKFENNAEVHGVDSSVNAKQPKIAINVNEDLQKSIPSNDAKDKILNIPEINSTTITPHKDIAANIHADGKLEFKMPKIKSEFNADISPKIKSDVDVLNLQKFNNKTNTDAKELKIKNKTNVDDDDIHMFHVPKDFDVEVPKDKHIGYKIDMPKIKMSKFDNKVELHADTNEILKQQKSKGDVDFNIKTRKETKNPKANFHENNDSHIMNANINASVHKSNQPSFKIDMPKLKMPTIEDNTTVQMPNNLTVKQSKEKDNNQFDINISKLKTDTKVKMPTGHIDIDKNVYDSSPTALKIEMPKIKMPKIKDDDTPDVTLNIKQPKIHNKIDADKIDSDSHGELQKSGHKHNKIDPNIHNNNLAEFDVKIPQVKIPKFKGESDAHTQNANLSIKAPKIKGDIKTDLKTTMENPPVKHSKLNNADFNVLNVKAPKNDYDVTVLSQVSLNQNQAATKDDVKNRHLKNDIYAEINNPIKNKGNDLHIPSKHFDVHKDTNMDSHEGLKINMPGIKKSDTENIHIHKPNIKVNHNMHEPSAELRDHSKQPVDMELYTESPDIKMSKSRSSTDFDINLKHSENKSNVHVHNFVNKPDLTSLKTRGEPKMHIDNNKLKIANIHGDLPEFSGNAKMNISEINTKFKRSATIDNHHLNRHNDENFGLKNLTKKDELFDTDFNNKAHKIKSEKFRVDMPKFSTTKFKGVENVDKSEVDGKVKYPQYNLDHELDAPNLSGHINIESLNSKNKHNVSPIEINSEAETHKKHGFHISLPKFKKSNLGLKNIGHAKSDNTPPTTNLDTNTNSNIQQIYNNDDSKAEKFKNSKFNINFPKMKSSKDGIDVELKPYKDNQHSKNKDNHQLDQVKNSHNSKDFGMIHVKNDFNASANAAIHAISAKETERTIYAKDDIAVTGKFHHKNDLNSRYSMKNINLSDKQHMKNDIIAPSSNLNASSHAFKNSKNQRNSPKLQIAIPGSTRSSGHHGDIKIDTDYPSINRNKNTDNSHIKAELDKVQSRHSYINTKVDNAKNNVALRLSMPANLSEHGGIEADVPNANLNIIPHNNNYHDLSRHNHGEKIESKRPHLADQRVSVLNEFDGIAQKQPTIELDSKTPKFNSNSQINIPDTTINFDHASKKENSHFEARKKQSKKSNRSTDTESMHSSNSSNSEIYINKAKLGANVNISQENAAGKQIKAKLGYKNSNNISKSKLDSNIDGKNIQGKLDGGNLNSDNSEIHIKNPKLDVNINLPQENITNKHIKGKLDSRDLHSTNKADSNDIKTNKKIDMPFISSQIEFDGKIKKPNNREFQEKFKETAVDRYGQINTPGININFKHSKNKGNIDVNYQTEDSNDQSHEQNKIHLPDAKFKTNISSNNADINSNWPNIKTPNISGQTFEDNLGLTHSNTKYRNTSQNVDVTEHAKNFQAKHDLDTSKQIRHELSVNTTLPKHDGIDVNMSKVKMPHVSNNVNVTTTNTDVSLRQPKSKNDFNLDNKNSRIKSEILNHNKIFNNKQNTNRNSINTDFDVSKSTQFKAGMPNIEISKTDHKAEISTINANTNIHHSKSNEHFNTNLKSPKANINIYHTNDDIQLRRTQGDASINATKSQSMQLNTNAKKSKSSGLQIAMPKIKFPKFGIKKIKTSSSDTEINQVQVQDNLATKSPKLKDKDNKNRDSKSTVDVHSPTLGNSSNTNVYEAKLPGFSTSHSKISMPSVPKLNVSASARGHIGEGVKLQN